MNDLPTQYGGYDPKSEENEPFLAVLKLSDITVKHLPDTFKNPADFIPDPKKFPRRLVTATQDAAARNVEGAIDAYIGNLAFFVPNAPFIADLTALRVSLSLIVTGNDWEAAAARALAGNHAFNQVWPQTIQQQVGNAQFPANLIGLMQNLGDNINAAAQVLMAAMSSYV